MSMQWEYIIEIIPGDKEQGEARLNELGADGWEVVSVWPFHTGFGMLLKKPKAT
jgi:hypothetical protein